MGHFDDRRLRPVTAAHADRPRASTSSGSAYADLIGTERGRDMLVNRVRPHASADGVAFCRSVYGTSPDGRRHRHRGRPGRRAAGRAWRSPTWRPCRPCRGSPASRTASPTCSTRTARPPRRARARPQARRRPVRRARACARWSGPELEFYVLEPDAGRPSGWSGTARRTGNVYVSGLQGRPGERAAALAAAPGRRTGSTWSRPTTSSASGQFEINLWHSEALARRRPGVPVQDRGQGAGPAGGQAGDVHGQAVQRRGRLGLPPALLRRGRRAARRCSTTSAGDDGLSEIGARGDRRTCSRTPRRWPRCTTRPSTPTSGSARTRWRRG